MSWNRRSAVTRIGRIFLRLILVLPSWAVPRPLGAELPWRFMLPEQRSTSVRDPAVLPHIPLPHTPMPPHRNRSPV